MILSEKQQAIVTTSANKVVVISAAASGKTRCITERLKYLLEHGVEPNKIVAITFTNAAAANIRERLGAICEGTFIGTVHSYANFLLVVHGIDTSNLLNNEEFDKLFDKVKANCDCILPVEHLLLDEAQDSTEMQFEFFELIKPKNFMYLGDFRQSIYRFSGASPDYLIELCKQEDVTCYHLNDNYRCGSKILDYAKAISRLNGIDYLDDSICMTGRAGQVTEMDLSLEGIARTIRARKEFGKWFILCRTNDQVDTMFNVLKRYDIPCDTFKRKDLTNQELSYRLGEDTVKVLTIHASKGLESPYVVVIGARTFDIEEKCISYVAATRAKQLLVWTRTATKKRRATMITNWET